jgi:glycosyltransferase involved in cell wall biosynthesis
MAKVICYLAQSARDWGGASRVLFTNIRLLDRSRYTPLVLLPYPGKITEELDSLGVRYRIWGKEQEPGNPIAYGKAVWRSLRMFRQEHVDVFHMNTYYWRPAEFVAARLLHIPVLVHYHLVGKASGPVANLSDGIVAVSRYVAENSKPARAKKYVIHNAIQLTSFDEAKNIRSELGIPNDAVVVTFVGQILTVKGIDMFLRMTRAVRHNNARFLIVGACRDPDKYKGAYTESRLNEEIGGDGRIIYTGYRSDIPNIYTSSDIVVVPSQWNEPFGLINIEAGASGKPVVATRVGGIPEIIDHGVNGFLVEPDDIQGLCEHVSALIDNEQLRVDMGKRGREIVERKFTCKPIEDLQRLYDSLT